MLLKFGITILKKTSSMAAYPKKLVVYLEFILQDSWNIMVFPTNIVETKLISMRVVQQFSCPFIAYHLASYIVMSSQHDSRLNHSNMFWISIITIFIYLGFYFLSRIFANVYASFCFIIYAISSWMDSCI